MESSYLEHISPIDGRYYDKTKPLQLYFSEMALFKYRCLVEVEYFIALCKIPLPQLDSFPQEKHKSLRKIYTDFSLEDAKKIKKIEKTTNHDVKAVEYFIKEWFQNNGLEEFQEFVHFGLTSQDVNNTATPLLLKEGVEYAIYPMIEQIIENLQYKAKQWSDVPMLARTHGQAASPTRLGKEIQVFAKRLIVQLEQIKAIPFSAKFGGAVGNFNAHFVTYPDFDWNNFANKFVEKTLGLHRSFPTTQIEHYDNISAFFHALQRINTIIIDACRDFWTYIMLDYFSQKTKENEVGSSAMPHKVNPIDFENAEGNLGVANALCAHFAEKLPISRLQRDLTDSTVLRNIGVPLSHSLIAYHSFLKGLGKLEVNNKKIEYDLAGNWAVVAEAIQTILRREKYPQPYEALKKLTRGTKQITQTDILQFIDSLDIDDKVKQELKKITPFNYIGI